MSVHIEVRLDPPKQQQQKHTKKQTNTQLYLYRWSCQASWHSSILDFFYISPKLSALFEFFSISLKLSALFEFFSISLKLSAPLEFFSILLRLSALYSSIIYRWSCRASWHSPIFEFYISLKFSALLEFFYISLKLPVLLELSIVCTLSTPTHAPTPSGSNSCAGFCGLTIPKLVTLEDRLNSERVTAWFGVVVLLSLLISFSVSFNQQQILCALKQRLQICENLSSIWSETQTMVLVVDVASLPSLS